ncbi:hypothetical protein KA005_75580 [bacterium]|nr:hypothetical protein [bacterium]
MKKRSILMLSILLTMTAVTFLPVNAAKPIIYSASGTLDDYYDYATAEIVGGTWTLKATENKVWFEAVYQEKNLDEEAENSPVGSIDRFELKLGKIGFWFIEGDTLTVVGHVRFKKEWVMMDGTTKTVIWWSGKGIEVSPDSIRIAQYPWPTSGDILGTTTWME